MAISRAQQAKQLLALGGRIGLQEGGIMPRLNQLGSGVSSAEQTLQEINQRLESAESSLGGGGVEQLQAVQPGSNNLFAGRPVTELQGQPMKIDPPIFMTPGNIPGTDAPFSSLRSGIPAASYADGGIASLQDPRQGYFLGKLVKKAKRAVKKVVKSPIGKAAILGGLTFGVPGTGFKGFLGGKGSIGSFFGKGSFNPLVAMAERGPGFTKEASGLAKLLGKFGLAEGTKLTGLGKIASIGGLSGLAGLLAAQEAEDEEGIDISDIDRGEGLNILDIVARARKNDPEFRFLPGAEFTSAYAKGGITELDAGAPDIKLEGDVKPKNMKMARSNMMNKRRSALQDAFEMALEKYMSNNNVDVVPIDIQEGIFNNLQRKMLGRAEGGLMDLGGMEMDLRGGGFVPIGAKEKADDVPARLSKNEFVMTADAVRAAGGGSIDKGADKMYNLMKDLEAKV